jgi:hypothetical protein
MVEGCKVTQLFNAFLMLDFEKQSFALLFNWLMFISSPKELE